jgi:hypothetical protein
MKCHTTLILPLEAVRGNLHLLNGPNNKWKACKRFEFSPQRSQRPQRNLFKISVFSACTAPQVHVCALYFNLFYTIQLNTRAIIFEATGMTLMKMMLARNWQIHPDIFSLLVGLRQKS